MAVKPFECNNGHILEPEVMYDHSCNMCGCSGTFFRCRQCDYDMCLKCTLGVELDLNKSMIQGLLPDYSVTRTEGRDNFHTVQKGNECCYTCCGGAVYAQPADQHFFQFQVGPKNNNVEVDVDLCCWKIMVGRAVQHYVLTEHARVLDVVQTGVMQALVNSEVYQSQADIQKTAVAPTQQAMASSPAGEGDPPAQTDIATQLEKLSNLYKDGLLTQEEFEEAKKNALANQ